MTQERIPACEETGALMEAAARWYDRLADAGVSDEERARFDGWLAAAPEHRVAYDVVQRTGRSLLNQAHDPRILALRHETALRLTRRPRRFPTTLRVAAAILVVAAGSLFIVAESPQQPLVHDVEQQAQAPEPIVDDVAQLGYSTGIGERLTVTLEDGSQVTLNTETALEATFTEGERRIVLTQGQALFEVAKDPGRPFIVQAHERQFVALGTAFDVRLEGARLQITMLEGVVRVERTSLVEPLVNAPQAPPPVVATLSAGEQLTVDAQDVDHIRATDVERVTSWRRGQVIFENARLIDALIELNRYSRTRIEIADESLRELRISGSFVTGRPDVFIEALTSYFPIRVAYDDDEKIVLASAN